MIGTLKRYIRRNTPAPIKERNAVEAYDMWAENYDNQPGNLMLDLDETVFSELLIKTVIKNKTIADIGCGTGRHWPKLLNAGIGSLTGFDVSPGMLAKLKNKFPETNTHAMTDNRFAKIADDTFDLIVSTLTVAHIQNIEEALISWSRILKDGGEIIITDFHPDALAAGGQRTFKHENKFIAVENFVHPITKIKDVLDKQSFRVVNETGRTVDESVRHYYEAKDALHVYDKFKGSPIIYGIHFSRGYGHQQCTIGR